MHLACATQQMDYKNASIMNWTMDMDFSTREPKEKQETSAKEKKNNTEFNQRVLHSVHSKRKLVSHFQYWKQHVSFTCAFIKLNTVFFLFIHSSSCSLIFPRLQNSCTRCCLPNIASQNKVNIVYLQLAFQSLFIIMVYGPHDHKMLLLSSFSSFHCHTE